MKYIIIGIFVLIVISAVVFNKPVKTSDVNNDVVTRDVNKDANKEVVENGDTVLIDFVGTVDGVAFDGGTASDFELKIGSKMFVDDFEEQLIGMKVGETRDVTVTFPENYTAELASKEAVFKTTLKAIK